MNDTRRYAAGLAAIVKACITGAAGLLAGVAGSASASGFPAFVGPLHRTSVIASTVPGNGDVNPYGTFVVPGPARCGPAVRGGATARPRPGPARA
ncbi:MAG: hypothetical protein ACRDOA_17025 [Streptosporangiaceae bacterium]